MRFSYITLIGLTSVLVSCGYLWKGSGDKKIQQQDSALVAKWKTECVGADALNLSHARRTIEFTMLGNFEKYENFYESDKCDNTQLAYKVEGTYATLGKNEDKDDLKNINFTVNKASLVPHSQAAADNMNTMNLCGENTWKQNEPKDITGKDCKGFTVERGDVIYDVYQVEGKNLYFGQKFFFLASDDADSRPDSVTKESPYLRQ